MFGVYIMPVPDVDYGLVWQGFSPSTLTHRLPKETYASVPFRFGGSNVRLYEPERVSTAVISKKIKVKR
jgi:hypothetical protein